MGGWGVDATRFRLTHRGSRRLGGRRRLRMAKGGAARRLVRGGGERAAPPQVRRGSRQRDEIPTYILERQRAEHTHLVPVSRLLTRACTPAKVPRLCQEPATPKGRSWARTREPRVVALCLFQPLPFATLRLFLATYDQTSTTP